MKVDIYSILSTYCMQPIIIRFAHIFTDDDIEYTLYNRRMRNTHLSYIRFMSDDRTRFNLYYYDNKIWDPRFNSIIFVNNRQIYYYDTSTDIHILEIYDKTVVKYGADYMKFKYNINNYTTLYIEWYANKPATMRICGKIHHGFRRLQLYDITIY